MMSTRKRKLFTPPSCRSALWQHFGFNVVGDDPEAEKNVDKTIAICRHCDKPVKYCSNTSNLKQHLERCTPYLTQQSGSRPSKAGSTVQTSMTQFCRPMQMLPSTSKRAKDITRGVVEHIAMDLKSFSTVEGKGFKKLMHIAVPEYVVPSRNTITKGVADLANSCRVTLMEDVAKIECVSLTLDYWTSLSVKSYVGVTCHFIDNNWKLVGNTLGTYLVTESHASENVTQHVNDVMAQWGIEEKTVAIVTDSAPNMVRAMMNVDTAHVRCSAHLLQLSIKKGFKLQGATDILQKGKRIVGHFNQSPSASTLLAEAQVARHLPQNKLIQDIVTRWNSTRDMLQSLTTNRSAINDILDEDEKLTHLKISRQELDKIVELHALLEPFSELTTLLGGDKYVSASIVIPSFTFLMKKVVTPATSDSRFIKDIKNAIGEDLATRLATLKQNNVLLAACALDLRFKRLTFLEKTEDQDKVWSLLKSELIELFRKDAHLRAQKPSRVEREPDRNFEYESDDDNPSRGKKSLLEELDSASSAASGNEDDLDVQDEILNYQTEKKISSDQDPLLWWKKNNRRYPVLSRLAKKYLCIPATSVPSERLFSTGGNIITKNRARLSGDNVDNLMFLHGYLHKKCSSPDITEETEISL